MTRLEEQTWPEVEALLTPDTILVVPVGATEQHGPHLPLSTDTDIAVAIAERLAADRPDVLVAPAVAIGSSGEHQSFAGTLSIGQHAIETVLVELARSATETFARVLFVSTHGGNARPVARAMRRLVAEDRDVRAWSPAACWEGDAHAGHVETSVMLALCPERVHVVAAAAGETRPLPELIGAMTTGGVAAVSRNGVLGDPTGARASEGDRLLAVAAERLNGAVDTWGNDERDWR